jgi:hypothetical protein
VFSPYAWGRISKLWSVEEGICHKVEMACSEGDPGPACEDLGDFTLPTPVLPPDEMGPPPPMPAAPLPQAIAAPPPEPKVAPPEPSAEEVSALCSFELPAATVSIGDEPTFADLAASFCAPPDEPNACERPMTALVSQPESAQRVDRAVLE